MWTLTLCLTTRLIIAIENITQKCSLVPILRTNALNESQMNMNNKIGQIYHIYTLYVFLMSPSPKFQPIVLYNQPFQSYTPISEKCIERLQSDSEQHGVQGTSYVFLLPVKLIFHSCSSHSQPVFSLRHYTKSSKKNNKKA